MDIETLSNFSLLEGELNTNKHILPKMYPISGLKYLTLEFGLDP